MVSGRDAKLGLGARPCSKKLAASSSATNSSFESSDKLVLL